MTRCRHVHALVIIASPKPGLRAVRWCPSCGALYHSIYVGSTGWSERREWQSPGGKGAQAYIALCNLARKIRVSNSRYLKGIFQ